MKLCAFADEASSLISGQIAALKRNEIPYIEIRGVNGKNINDISLHEASEIKKALDDEGIKVFSIGSPIGKASLSEDIAKQTDDLKRTVEKAGIFGASRIRMFSFYPDKGESEERARGKVFRNLEKLCSVTPKDIILCHENEKGIFGDSAENCLELLNNFPTVRAVFDPANFVQCGEDTLRAWHMLSHRVEYIHVKDALSCGMVVPCGRGVGNLAVIIKDYLEHGGEFLTLEPHLFAFTGLSSLENNSSSHIFADTYKDNDDAFDAAANALYSTLRSIGKEN